MEEKDAVVAVEEDEVEVIVETGVIEAIEMIEEIDVAVGEEVVVIAEVEIVMASKDSETTSK